VVLIAAAFAFADPQNNCVSNGEFVASQITNGLIIGIIYGFMALGLTLIFSILGVVSFAHGEFYMIGGMLVYYITAVWLPGLNPLMGGGGGLRHRLADRRGLRTADADADVSRARSTGRWNTASWRPLAWPSRCSTCPGAARGEPGQGAALHRLSAHPSGPRSGGALGGPDRRGNLDAVRH
jgi:hypothetical protein